MKIIEIIKSQEVQNFLGQLPLGPQPTINDNYIQIPLMKDRVSATSFGGRSDFFCAGIILIQNAGEMGELRVKMDNKVPENAFFPLNFQNFVSQDAPDEEVFRYYIVSEFGGTILWKFKTKEARDQYLLFFNLLIEELRGLKLLPPNPKDKEFWLAPLKKLAAANVFIVPNLSFEIPFLKHGEDLYVEKKSFKENIRGLRICVREPLGDETREYIVISPYARSGATVGFLNINLARGKVFAKNSSDGLFFGLCTKPSTDNDFFISWKCSNENFRDLIFSYLQEITKIII